LNFNSKSSNFDRVGDNHKGPLNNRGKPTSSRKKRKRELIHEPKNAHTKAITTLVAPAAHLNAPSGEVRLARGLNAPSGEVRLARGPPRARHPRSCSHVRAFNALTPQDCTTTLTCLGIMPRRCYTHSLGKTIPATIQHCAERPVSAPRHCVAYFCMANTPSPRRGADGTLEWGRMLFL
jgi:hypothetical protein